MVGLKLKNICNFIDNSKLKKNSNQKNMDQMWRKNKLQGLVWISKEASAEFNVERWEKKETIIGVKLKERLGHVLPYHVESTYTFKMLKQKATFGDQMTLHVSLR